MDVLPSATLSITTPTLPSEERENDTLPMPRMLSAPNGPAELSAGALRMRSATSFTFWRCNCAPSTTETETGTSCSRCSRLLAVTMTC